MTDVLLHYPDGSVSKELKRGVTPDAFLFVCPQGTSYWVSLKFSVEPVSYDEAQSHVAQIKIDGKQCQLPYLFPLWRLLRVSFQVDALLAHYGLPQLPDGQYWSVLPAQSNDYRGVQINGRDVHAFVADRDKTRAIALPFVPVDEHEYVAEQERQAERERKSSVANQKKLQNENQTPPRHLKPMRSV